ncbi:MAG: SipW-dependent-type signal peptide-containing protein [Actinomycetota bacterium]|nr:SipW-dependent-type signal peptide-containing protein [Actinomycetota bacterium]
MAGALGVGALGLALVGPGSFASFTSSVTANQSITAGTFQLQGVASTPTVSGPLIGDANSIGQPSLQSANGSEPTAPNFNGNTLSFTLGNISPGDTYTEPVTIYDVGTLQGQLNTVTYTPDAASTAQALESNMTVALQEDINGTWTDVHTQGEETACGGCGSSGVPVSAAASHTFMLNYSFGPSFVQPNPKMYTSTEASAAGFSTNELSASYRVVFSFTNTSGSQNSLETVSASPSLSFNGVNTP